MTDESGEIKPATENSTVSAPQPKQKKENFFLETVKFIVITLLIVIPFRYFIAQPFIVSGDSMVPTFENGEYLIVDEISYRFSPPARGDVVIFRYPLDPSKFFIKRIIGLPGETVQIKGTAVQITTTDGITETLNEPYVTTSRDDNINVKLQTNQYYVLGDNRPASSDSRIWGPLPSNDIIGKPVVRLLPLNRIGLSPGAKNETATTTNF